MRCFEKASVEKKISVLLLGFRITRAKLCVELETEGRLIAMLIWQRDWYLPTEEQTRLCVASLMCVTR